MRLTKRLATLPRPTRVFSSPCRLQIVRVHQPGQRMLHQLLKREVESQLPHGVERNRHHLEIGNGQQVA